MRRSALAAELGEDRVLVVGGTGLYLQALVHPLAEQPEMDPERREVVAQIIGEINDEFDDADNFFFQEIDSDTFIFEGKVSLNDFCKKLEIDPTLFEDVKGESESLGGLLLELNSKFPKNGTKIHFEDFEFTVLAVDSRKIKKIKVYLKPEDKENQGHFTD